MGIKEKEESCKHDYKLTGYVTKGGDGRGDGELELEYTCKNCGKKVFKTK